MNWFSVVLCGALAMANSLGGPASIESTESKHHDTNQDRRYVRVSPRDPRYFELSDGTPYIPIGLNLIGTGAKSEAEILATMEEWMKKLSENGGNYVRIWLSNDNWDVEHTKSGQYDGEKARRVDALLEMAGRYNLRVKMTLEHFRHFNEEPRWSAKAIHHVSQGGPAQSVADFFTGQQSRDQFKRKLDWYASRFGNDPIIFAWELWNEINAVESGGRVLAQMVEEIEWTEVMLAELQRRFPKNMSTQSLGSFDVDRVRETYDRVCRIPGNDIANVHRYLDLGAELEICHGPVDVLVADAVSELRAFGLRKPILLAESGAVEPNHTGPFKLYQKDKDGTILHDVLFAPFFAGAAGPGQIWHWNRYVDALDLWYHFARFAEAAKDVDPAGEDFDPVELAHPRLRVYALKGTHILLAWCRDANNTWRTELQEGRPPETIRGATVDVRELIGALDGTDVRFYDPWKGKWTTGSVDRGRITLPDFTRSIVFRIESSRAP